MRKIIIALLALFACVYGQYATRAWVLGTLRGGTLDSIVVKYVNIDLLNTDTLRCYHLYGNFAFVDTVTGDTCYFQHIVANFHINTDSLYAEHIVANVHINADSVDTDHLVANVYADIDSLLLDHFYLGDTSSRGNAIIAQGGQTNFYHDTLIFWDEIVGGWYRGGRIYTDGCGIDIDNTDQYGNSSAMSIRYDDETNCAWVVNNIYRPEGDTIDGSNQTYHFGMGLFRLYEVFSRYIRSSAPDKSDTITITIDADSGRIISENPIAINNDVSVTGDMHASANLVSDSVYAEHVVGNTHMNTDSLYAEHIIGNTNTTTDSVDAQHVVADVHVQTDSIDAEHATIDTFNADVVVKGAVKPEYVTWDLISGSSFSASSGATDLYYHALNGATSDSIIIDSLLICYSTSHADVYIDSVTLQSGYSRIGINAYTLFTDGTDVGVGTAWVYDFISYTTPFPATASSDWRLCLKMKVETSATSGKGYIFTCKVYGHYK